jgi:hypothetical protein
MTPATARAYFEYGNALLTKEEELSAQGVLGNINDGNLNEKCEDVDDSDGEDNEEDEEGEDEEGEDEGEVGDAEGGDIQIAWETLDVCDFYFWS